MLSLPRLSRLLAAAVAAAAAFAVTATAAQAHHPKIWTFDPAVEAGAYAGLEFTRVGPCAGGYRIESTAFCTHGPDEAGDDGIVSTGDYYPSNSYPAGGDAIYAGAGSKIHCAGNGSGGKRVQVLYVRASDVADDYAGMKDDIVQWALGADRIYRESAAETTGTRRIRWAHDSGCNLTVDSVVVAPPDDDTFNATITAVQAQGYNLTNRKYLMFVDGATVYCGVGGHIQNDLDSPANPSNGGPGYGRVDFDKANCNPEDWAAAHELMHNLGGVQSSAPNWNGKAHCLDDADRMCYDQGIPGFVFDPTACPDPDHERLFDCNHDDYFHTEPAAGSYLDTHWNTADSDYLEAGPENLWGFVRTDEALATTTTPSGDHNQSSSNAKNTVARVATGVYDVTFTNLANYDGKAGTTLATAYGTAGEHCTTSQWRSDGGPDTIVVVRCFSAAGNPVDVRFDAAFIRPVTTSGPFAYLWANQETSASYNPSTPHQFNSTGGLNSIVRNGTGDYTVTLPGLASEGGTVKVTAFSATSSYCKAADWDAAGADEEIEVDCYDFTGAPADAKFTLVYADETSIVANGAANGYVRATDQTNPAYTPNSAYQHNSTGVLNTVVRNSTGSYTVTFPGLGTALGLSFNRGHVQATAEHTSSKRCQVSSWSSGFVPLGQPVPLNVNVACHTAAGTPADARFVVQFTK
jgi:hypothetical protein